MKANEIDKLTEKQICASKNRLYKIYATVSNLKLLRYLSKYSKIFLRIIFFSKHSLR